MNYVEPVVEGVMYDVITQDLRAIKAAQTGEDLLSLATTLRRHFVQKFKVIAQGHKEKQDAAKVPLDETLRNCIKLIVKSKSTAETIANDQDILRLWDANTAPQAIEALTQNFTKEEDKTTFGNTVLSLYYECQYEAIVADIAGMLNDKKQAPKLTQQYAQFNKIKNEAPTTIKLEDEILSGEGISDTTLYNKLSQVVRYADNTNNDLISCFAKQLNDRITPILADNYAVTENNAVSFSPFLEDFIGTNGIDDDQLITTTQRPFLQLSDAMLQRIISEANTENIDLVQFAKKLTIEANERKMSLPSFLQQLTEIDPNKAINANFETLMKTTVSKLTTICRQYDLYLDTKNQADRNSSATRPIAIELGDVDNETRSPAKKAVTPISASDKKYAITRLCDVLNDKHDTPYEKVRKFRKYLTDHRATLEANRDPAGKRFVLSAVNILSFGFVARVKKGSWCAMWKSHGKITTKKLERDLRHEPQAIKTQATCAACIA